MLYRYWQTWRAKVHLFDTRNQRPSTAFYATKLCFPECEPDRGDTSRHFQPYEGLADIWHPYAGTIHPDYPAFIAKLAKVRKLEVQSILDLACGTGTMTARLASIAPQVVGIDLSEPMLVKARSQRCSLPGVTFVRGDIRSSHLGQQFEVVVCACNSLNYLTDIAELGSVFQNVAEHLRPGGLFVFDTITELGMRVMSGYYLHITFDETRFAMHFEYDPKSRTERAEILLPSGSENHVQIPIDPSDVKTAARNSGLVVEDYFTKAFWPGWWHTGTGSYFVLRCERT